MCKLFLGQYLYTEQARWVLLFPVLLLASVMVVSYIFCIFCAISAIRYLEYAWSWGVEPVLWLSGMWAPSYIIMQSKLPGIRYVTLFNPFAYATESIRQLFFNDVIFASLEMCCTVMIASTLVFSLLSYFLMKRQIQAV
jgi:ABC-type polysaccharide/polyol phosphate export permease